MTDRVREAIIGNKSPGWKKKFKGGFGGWGHARIQNFLGAFLLLFVFGFFFY